jgi:hypothetical protein
MQTELKTYTIECEDCGGTGHDRGGLRENEPETCLVCNGAGTLTSEYQIGDRIEYRHDETHALITATVTGYGIEGWLSVHDEGTAAEDDADIHVSLIVRTIALAASAERMAA